MKCENCGNDEARDFNKSRDPRNEKVRISCKRCGSLLCDWRDETEIELLREIIQVLEWGFGRR